MASELECVGSPQKKMPILSRFPGVHENPVFMEVVEVSDVHAGRSETVQLYLARDWYEFLQLTDSSEQCSDQIDDDATMIGEDDNNNKNDNGSSSSSSKQRRDPALVVCAAAAAAVERDAMDYNERTNRDLHVTAKEPTSLLQQCGRLLRIAPLGSIDVLLETTLIVSIEPKNSTGDDFGSVAPAGVAADSMRVCSGAKSRRKKADRPQQPPQWQKFALQFSTAAELTKFIEFLRVMSERFSREDSATGGASASSSSNRSLPVLTTTAAAVQLPNLSASAGQVVAAEPVVAAASATSTRGRAYGPYVGEESITSPSARQPAPTHLELMDTSTVETYFQYYSKMSNQMNMLQDSVRTSLYQNAITQNPTDFSGKTVMDVGAGSGILSFFAAQAGAAKVYAVEASQMASAAAELAAANADSGGSVIEVVNSAVEALSLSQAKTMGQPTIPTKVDTIVSEPIGTFLFNERMIESYLYARDNFLKPGGMMFPNRLRLGIAPFTDTALYNDMSMRCQFWFNDNFYGINLSSVAARAREEQFRQPIVDYIDPSILLAPQRTEEFDLRTISRQALHHIEIPFVFTINSPSLVHGIAGWFDVLFDGSDTSVGFSTSPWSPPTHWYQIRFLFRTPLAVNPGQTIEGLLVMSGNTQQSYNVAVSAKIVGTNVSTSSTIIDLKDPDYRYFSCPSATYCPTHQANSGIQQQQTNSSTSYAHASSPASNFHTGQAASADAVHQQQRPPAAGRS